MSSPNISFVAEVVPLKQGLKLFKKAATHSSFPSCRGSSIKTRIETLSCQQKRKQAKIVAEVVPLKQGLKQFDPGTSVKNCPSCRGSSIKTRIETEIE